MHNSPPNHSICGRTCAVLIAVLTAGAVILTSTAAYASDIEARRASSRATATPEAEPTRSVGLSNAEVEELLELLAAVPDVVLAQGGKATLAHLRATHPELGVSPRLSLPSAKCVGLVAAAVAGALIPAGKVVKLAMIAKKYGVKRVANALIGVRKGMGRKYPDDLKDAALILLGVDQIKAACK
ncbi:hypothetical protein [Streptomyces sp. NPDC052114]|uniref:hypothetical protein n=1 Tax=unclassified Streptomyces TaxID=2593676 RepID=UPI0034215BD6